MRDQEVRNKEHKLCTENGTLFEPKKKSTLQTRKFLATKIKQTENEIKNSYTKTKQKKLKLTCSDEQSNSL